MYKRVFLLAFLAIMTGQSFAQSIPMDTIHSLTQINNAYGIRIGVGFRDDDPMVKPIFNPYFEVPIGVVFFSAEVQLSFLDINTLNIFQSNNLRLDAYGWAGKIKWHYGHTSDDRLFSSIGLGMTVHQTSASIELPLSTGYIWTLSQSTEFESVLNFTPLTYIGQKRGWFVSATIGLRFLNF